MRKAFVVALIVTSTGCDLIKGKLDGDAGATAATAAPPANGGLPPECETFLTRYSCFLKKSGKPTTEADDMRTQWTAAVAQPAARAGIANVCTTQLGIQAQNFKSAGCDAAVAAPAAKAAEDAGKAATTATTAAAAATASVTAAPNVDAKGRPCKASEVVFNGLCRNTCRIDNDCKEGLVCNVPVPGRTEKVCGDVICRAPEKRLRENHFEVHCAVPCNTNADCPAGKKCGSTLYSNEEANNAVTHGCQVGGS